MAAQDKKLYEQDKLYTKLNLATSSNFGLIILRSLRLFFHCRITTGGASVLKPVKLTMKEKRGTTKGTSEVFAPRMSPTGDREHAAVT